MISVYITSYQVTTTNTCTYIHSKNTHACMHAHELVQSPSLALWYDDDIICMYLSCLWVWRGSLSKPITAVQFQVVHHDQIRILQKTHARHY